MAEILALLRTDTAALHDRLLDLPFFRALNEGQLPRPAIATCLRCLAIIHGVLDRELAQCAHEGVAKLVQHALPKTPLLLADLEAWGLERVPSVIPATRGALDCSAEVLVGADDPLSLVGTLYALESLQKNGDTLRQGCLKCLPSHGARLSYFGCYGQATAPHWDTFETMLIALAPDLDRAQRVARSAVQCFEWLGRIFAGLHPYTAESLRHHVTEVNFEAGDHAMPQNPLEIGAALRAGAISWSTHAYLDRRFGDRGKRCINSDSCWLVVQMRLPVETVTKTLRWYRTLLASRGIPTVVLAGHLRVVQQSFAETFPEQPDIPESYNLFLADLDAERRASANPDLMLRIIEKFGHRLHGCDGLTVESAAELIASAWADERAGITGALAAVRDWFTDAERFSGDWIATVHALVAQLDQPGGSPC